MLIGNDIIGPEGIIIDVVKKQARIGSCNATAAITEEAETRYHTTEREALAMVRCLAEVKCYVVGHKYPVMIYTDHMALESIMRSGTDAHGRIARWMDRLTEYDYYPTSTREGNSHGNS